MSRYAEFGVRPEEILRAWPAYGDRRDEALNAGRLYMREIEAQVPGVEGVILIGDFWGFRADSLQFGGVHEKRYPCVSRFEQHHPFAPARISPSGRAF